MIAVQDLTVRYDGRLAVDGVSFAIPRGGCFGLVGESGSGKSTVLRAIAGLAEDWDGRLLLDGAPLPRRRPPELRRRLAMVFQDPYGSLHPRQTIDRQLAEPLLIHGIPGQDARIRRALDEVALPRSARFRYPHQLSGGQRQRVAIARALIAEPEALLLDEPTSALDVSVQAEILNLLTDLRAGRGLTCLLVSHNLAVVAHLCEALAVLQGGHLVEQLTSDALREGKTASPYTEELRRLSLELEE